MKKLRPILCYILTIFCFPIVIITLSTLSDRHIIAMDKQRMIILYALVSAAIGLCWQRKWPIDWHLAIILPVSLAVGYFCVGLLDHIYDIPKPCFDVRHALSVVTNQPLWLYVLATLPGLLTAFLCKFIKPRWLRFTCIGLLALAAVLFLLFSAFRFYSAETVKTHFEKHQLHTGENTAEDVTEKGILTSHHYYDFFKNCKKNDTTMEEIHAMFGAPHALCDSDGVWDVYFTIDGQLVLIKYNKGHLVTALSEIRLK